MRSVFVDAVYLVALAIPCDPWHVDALAAADAADGARLVITEEVLSEFLAGVARSGSAVRNRAADQVYALLRDEQVGVFEQSHDSFLDGLVMYAQRLDKGYSLTDCISMRCMEREHIREVLTNDKHFRQEGFQPLMRLAD